MLFLKKTAARHIWTTLTTKYSYAMLFQHGGHNIMQVIFLINIACQPWPNTAQVKSLNSLYGPDKTKQNQGKTAMYT